MRKLAAALLLMVAGVGIYWYLMLRPDEGTQPRAQAREPAAAAAVTVEAVPVRVGTVTRTITAVGTLQSNESVILRPEIAGRIARIHFQEGERVEAGVPLITLDDSVYRAELAQAEAGLNLSRQNAQRAQELFQRRVGTARTRDEAAAALGASEAEVALARARLEKTRLAAPFSGVLGLRRVSVGDYVNPGQDIVNLENIDPIKVDFRVPEPALSDIRVGQSVEVQVDAFPGETFTGEAYAIDPRIDADGRSVVIRARLENDDRRLRPGLFARVEVIVERRPNALLVPEQAIVPLQDRVAVFRVVDDKAVLATVRLGQRRAAEVEIVEGLSEGDIVVTAGQLKIRDGAAVTVKAPIGQPEPRSS